MTQKHKTDFLTRWRHRHGFGVHSPFAYYIVKNVVAPGRDIAYYGYREIDIALETVHSGYNILRNDARTLLRLCATLKPSGVWLPAVGDATPHPAFHVAAKAVDNDIKISTTRLQSPPADMQIALFPCAKQINSAILTDPDKSKDFQSLTDSIISYLAADGNCAILLDADFDYCLQLFSSFSGGLLLHGRHLSLLFHRSGMQKLVYAL